MNAEPAGGAFITGGTGLVGSHVAERLREEGRSVRVLCRPGSSRWHLHRVGAEPVEGDVLAGREELEAAMAGCSAVIHAAAAVYADWPWSRLRALNVGGARRVAQAAARAGARHFVHVSSVAVYGPVEGPVDETDSLETPLRPEDHYAHSKRQAETAVRDVAGQTGLPLTILRPAVVHGERDRLFTPRLAGLLRWPVLPVPGSGTAPLPVVYAGNVADCVARIVEVGDPRERGDPPRTEGVGQEGGRNPAPETYNLASDDDALDLRGLLEGLATGMERRPPRLVPVPFRLAAAGARVADLIHRAVPGERAVPPYLRAVRLAGRGNPYRSDRVREGLDWRPPFSSREALARTGRWAAGAIARR